MSEGDATITDPAPGGAFGPNAWLVDDMYAQYRVDPSSVSESWREFFADYAPATTVHPGGRSEAASGEPVRATPATPSPAPGASSPAAAAQVVSAPPAAASSSPPPAAPSPAAGASPSAPGDAA